MKFKFKNILSKDLYIFFIFLSLIIFFFSTDKTEAKSFEINNIDISTPFEINFDKNKVIDDGFKKAFFRLMTLTVNSSDQIKTKNIKMNEIKAMIESFSIKEEKFIDEIYYVKMGVSFNRKKIFSYLEKNNIFPSIPIKKKLLFIPVLIEENNNKLLIYEDNRIFDDWNNHIKDSHLIEYVLPTEDLEDMELIKKNFEYIENYDFKKIIDKYYLKDSIVALIFKKNKDLRILSRITIKDEVILKNQTFENVELDNQEQTKYLIENLKIIYEDYWKNSNQINTSIKLLLNIKIKNNDNNKILDFEELLDNTDSVNDYYIVKFDKNFTYYQIIFNGTSDIFLKDMKEQNYNFDTQNIIWILQ